MRVGRRAAVGDQTASLQQQPTTLAGQVILPYYLVQTTRPPPLGQRRAPLEFFVAGGIEKVHVRSISLVRTYSRAELSLPPRSFAA